MPTVGIELEIEGLSKQAAVPLQQRFNCRVGDDRTVRGMTYQVDGQSILPIRSARKSIECQDGYIVPPGAKRAEVIGLEIISPVMDEATAVEYALCVQRLYGHIPQTLNTSIHIHVDVAGKPWTYIQNLLRWGYYLELPLLRMASAGGIHRGGRIAYGDECNDYAFTRPLSKPIAAMFPRELKPVVSMTDVLDAQSASELAAAWGRLDVISNEPSLRNSHYLPHRLHMLNPVAIMRQGTMEHRYFDAVYRRLPDFLQLVLRLHKLADTTQPDFEPMLLGTQPPPYLGADWLSSLLGMDLTAMWTGRSYSSSSSSGSTENWPLPVREVLRAHHYGNWDYRMYPVQAQPVVPFFNNQSQSDDGSNDFSLYIRQ